jgi:hypothetical protein
LGIVWKRVNSKAAITTLMALVLGNIHDSRVLLGSATPDRNLD